jgi:hypothetical protein
MPYTVVLPPAVNRQIAGLGLPDFVFVEVHLRLATLRDRPADSLVRLTVPFDGMGFGFEMIDPTNRLCVHRFLFPVVYAADEERLVVELPYYERRVG